MVLIFAILKKKKLGRNAEIHAKRIKASRNVMDAVVKHVSQLAATKKNKKNALKNVLKKQRGSRSPFQLHLRLKLQQILQMKLVLIGMKRAIKKLRVGIGKQRGTLIIFPQALLLLVRYAKVGVILTKKTRRKNARTFAL